MKTVIVFAGKHGTSEKVAAIIAEKMGKDNCDIFNLKTKPMVDLSKYNRLIIGGSIHAGMMNSAVRKFIAKNMVTILGKKTGLFVCSMNEKEYDKQVAAAFPQMLLSKAVCVKDAGGEFLLEKMNFLERWIVRKVSGVRQPVSNIKYDNIDALIEEIKK